MWKLWAELATTICISIICQKSMSAMGKKDYADVVRLAGISLYGTTAIKMLQYIKDNSKVVKAIKNVGEFIDFFF